MTAEPRPTPRREPGAYVGARGQGARSYPSLAELEGLGVMTLEFVEGVIESACEQFYRVDDLRREQDGTSCVNLSAAGDSSWLTQMRLSATGALISLARSFDGGETWGSDAEGEENMRRIIWESQILAAQNLRPPSTDDDDPLAAWR